MHDTHYLPKFIPRQRLGGNKGIYLRNTSNQLRTPCLGAHYTHFWQISNDTEFHAPTPIQRFNISNPDGPWVVACSPLGVGGSLTEGPEAVAWKVHYIEETFFGNSSAK